MAGVVTGIFIAAEAGALMQRVEQARTVSGRGLEGDRYYFQQGSFSRWPGPHRELTLIAVEGLEEMARETGIELAPEQSRRNILTRGTALNELVGQAFYAGPVLLRGMRLCQPCKYLARLVDEPDLVRALLNRGGIRARILSEGVISVGDAVRPG